MTLTLFPKESIDIDLKSFARMDSLHLSVLHPTENRTCVSSETHRRMRFMFHLTLRQYIMVIGEETNESWEGMRVLYDSKDLN